MTTVQMKPAQTTFQSNWKTIFPDFTTLTGSCQFIKKLMAVSVSAITYLRGVFPERAYGERNLCGIKLKLLTEESGIGAVDKFIDFVRSCYDAIDRKYLHQVSIGICTDPENKDEVLESYNINFRYRDDEYSVSNEGSSMKLDESDPTVQATLMLLKSIFYITDILGPLPKDSYLTMKLLFNDEVTPPDYQPPGFEPSDNEKFFFPPNAVKLELGKVSTDFNNYRMFLKTVLSKEPLSQIYEESVLSGSQRSQNNESKEENEQENLVMPSQSKVSLKSTDDFVIPKPSQGKVGKVECLCDCKEDSGTKLIQCSVCGKKQHSICYGILNTHEVDHEFCCIDCVSEVPCDLVQKDIVYTYEGDEQKELCSFRRALVFCSSLKQVTPFQLEKGLKCDKQLAKDMIARLEMEGYVKKSGQKYIVDEKKIIKKGYWMYFRKTEDKENLESSRKTKASPAKVSDDEEFERGRTAPSKRKSNIMTEKESPLEEMEFSIEREVKKLNLRGSTEKQVNKSSKRRSYKTVVEDDSEEALQKKPKKRRCVNKNEIINLRE